MVGNGSPGSWLRQNSLFGLSNNLKMTAVFRLQLTRVSAHFKLNNYLK